MVCTKWHLAIVLFLFSLTNSVVFSTELTDKAWQYINQKDFSLAKKYLEENIALHPKDTQLKFLYARTLSWSGENKVAINVFDELLTIYPNNPDFLLSKALVISRSDSPKNALPLLKTARNIAPNYKDIWQLEIKILEQDSSKQAQEQAGRLNEEFLKRFNLKAPPIIKSPKSPQSYFASIFSYDNLNNNKKCWLSEKFQVGTKRNSIVYQIDFETISRFDITDQNIEASLNSINYKNYIFSAGGGYSAKSKLFPSWSTFASVDKMINKSWGINYEFRHKSYKSVTTDLNKISFRKRIKNWEPSITNYITTINQNEITLSFGGKISYFFTDYDFIRVQYNFGNELEYQNKVRTIYNIKTFSIDGRKVFNQSWQSSITYHYHIQGKAYSKHGVVIGLQYRF